MTGREIHDLLSQALQYHHAREYQQAEALYERLLLAVPDNADGLHLLGVLCFQTNRPERAVGLIGRAVVSNPAVADFHNNLGLALSWLARLDEAELAFTRALEIRPLFPQAHCNLADVLQRKGRLDEAIAHYRQALSLKPKYLEAHNNLGNALQTRGRVDQAIAEFRNALAIQPDYPNANFNLANALAAKGDFQAAVEAYRKTIPLKQSAEVYNNLGLALYALGDYDGASGAYQMALELEPGMHQAHNNLGNVLMYGRGDLDAALACYQRALAVRADYADGHVNVGNVMRETGQIDQAIAAFDLAIALNPFHAAAHSNRVYSMYFHSGYDDAAIATALEQWNLQHAGALLPFIKPHANDRNSHRPLRVGFISPDFRQHVVGWNLLPLLEQLDRNQFELICYANGGRVDSVTRALKARADLWREIGSLDDDEAADLVRSDGIDILVDLTLHMAGNRMLLLARKPAPVQMTWLAYCGSSGLEMMDYRLSDPWMDPPTSDTSLWEEKTIRLPQTYWCYRPGGPTPDVSALPALANGFITFGCLNSFAKISAPTLGLWARLLAEVPESRIIIHCLEGSHRQAVLKVFEQAGVSGNRVELVGRQPWDQYIATYRRIDVALDCFPYSGGITTLDAIWMGVPLVTLVGKTAVGRGGASILQNVGMPELIANDQDAYLAKAKSLAGDSHRLIHLRSSLRQALQSSPLMDSRRFARNMESIFRDVWARWCDREKS